MLSDLSGSDAIDNWVKTAWKEQVHDANKKSARSWETVSDPIWQESCQYKSQTDDQDDDVSDAGMQSFSTGCSWVQHRDKYDNVWSSDTEEIIHSDQEHCEQPNQTVDSGASTGQLNQSHVFTNAVVYHIIEAIGQFSCQNHHHHDHDDIPDQKGDNKLKKSGQRQLDMVVERGADGKISVQCHPEQQRWLTSSYEVNKKHLSKAAAKRDFRQVKQDIQ